MKLYFNQLREESFQKMKNPLVNKKIIQSNQTTKMKLQFKMSSKLKQSQSLVFPNNLKQWATPEQSMLSVRKWMILTISTIRQTRNAWTTLGTKVVASKAWRISKKKRMKMKKYKNSKMLFNRDNKMGKKFKKTSTLICEL